jgi:hypothetical protein
MMVSSLFHVKPNIGDATLSEEAGRMEILDGVGSDQATPRRLTTGVIPMSEDDVHDELARLKAENERLKDQQARGLSLKVSEKGALSVYGLGRFPVTLYKEQWTKLLSVADDIKAFLKENDSRLKTKT